MTKFARLFTALTAAALTLAPVALAQSAALPTPLLTTDTAQLEVFAQTPAVAVVTYYSAAPDQAGTRILGETTLNWRSNAARAAQMQAHAPAGTKYVRLYTGAQATVMPYDAAFAAQADALARQSGGVMPVQALN